MLEMSDVEERAARCNVCSGELSLTENLILGNRCRFCVRTDFLDIGVVDFLWLCYYDHKLWKQIGMLIQVKGCDEARLLVLGCISECGGINMACMRSVKDKRALIKAIGRVGK